MTTVDWAVICDSPYFDTFDHLCLFGIDTSGAIPTLPAGVHRLAVAMHLQERNPLDDLDVSVFVTSPHGQWKRPMKCETSAWRVGANTSLFTFRAFLCRRKASIVSNWRAAWRNLSSAK